MVLPAIPPLAITFIAATIFIIALFGLTDWFEIIALAIVITIAIYVIVRYK